MMQQTDGRSQGGPENYFQPSSVESVAFDEIVPTAGVYALVFIYHDLSMLLGPNRPRCMSLREQNGGVLALQIEPGPA
jgi:hypothetical protein